MTIKMRVLPLYDMRSKEEMAILMKRMKEHTETSIKGLPDHMILIDREDPYPMMTLKELKEKIADKKRTNNGVTAE